MSYNKKIGVIDQLPRKGLQVFVGYCVCPDCNKTIKHYLNPADARALAHTFVIDYKIDEVPLMNRIGRFIPKISIEWGR